MRPSGYEPDIFGGKPRSSSKSNKKVTKKFEEHKK